MKNKVFTSSLDGCVFERLSTYSIKNKKPKNKIIEEALNLYFQELDKIEYAKSFKEMSKDKEMIELAESGLGDYNLIFKNYEK
ncbi:MAG: CopG family transcriptional regulator [Ignavibacteria bacterium]|nr:CopG family transcriptional regulator [Ignavibacteria bacterium]HCN36255.1 CopG family transcriptional regulator [Bacteroidota bacterium]